MEKTGAIVPRVPQKQLIRQHVRQPTFASKFIQTTVKVLDYACVFLGIDESDRSKPRSKPSTKQAMLALKRVKRVKKRNNEVLRIGREIIKQSKGNIQKKVSQKKVSFTEPSVSLVAASKVPQNESWRIPLPTVAKLNEKELPENLHDFHFCELIDNAASGITIKAVCNRGAFMLKFASLQKVRMDQDLKQRIQQKRKTLRYCDFTTQQKLEHERNVLSSLGHYDHIVTYVKNFYDKQSGVRCTVLSDPGTTFDEFLFTAKDSNFNLTLDVVFQGCEGLDYIHKQGVVHRGIKPSNLRYCYAQHRLKIYDFTEAIMLPYQSYTTGHDLLKSQYLAPEVSQWQPYNHRSDMYSYGLVIISWFEKAKVPKTPVTFHANIHKSLKYLCEDLIDLNPRKFKKRLSAEECLNRLHSICQYHIKELAVGLNIHQNND